MTDWQTPNSSDWEHSNFDINALWDDLVYLWDDPVANWGAVGSDWFTGGSQDFATSDAGSFSTPGDSDFYVNN